MASDRRSAAVEGRSSEKKEQAKCCLFIQTRALHSLSAKALQERLVSGNITSLDLIESCLDRIHRYNGRLRCLLAIRPRSQLLDDAALLDNERSLRPGKLRSKLHGIPIILKDVIVTGPELGMPTTVGSAVFANMRPTRNAPVVDLLKNAGMIILGKSNMTEFCGVKSEWTPSGWSSVGGQTKSPYRQRNLAQRDQPISSGSSSGSAVAVAAGFAPLAIGTEVCGGLVHPASVCGVYAYKCPHNTVPMEGVFSISKSYDCIGPIARHATDIIDLVEILQQCDSLGAISRWTTRSYRSDFHGLSIGAVNTTWGVDETSIGKWSGARLIQLYESAISILREHGAHISYPASALEPVEISHMGQNLFTTAVDGFTDRISEFLRCFERTPIKELIDVIHWNRINDKEGGKAHVFRMQETLWSLWSNRRNPAELEAIINSLRSEAIRMRPLKSFDIVLSSSDSSLVSTAALAGWPCATVPLSNWEENGQPYGMYVMASDEKSLLRFMSGWGRIIDRRWTLRPDLEMMP